MGPGRISPGEWWFCGPKVQRSQELQWGRGGLAPESLSGVRLPGYHGQSFNGAGAD